MTRQERAIPAPCAAAEDLEPADTPDACLPWTGPFVQVAICEPDELERSLERGELGADGDIELDPSGRREVAASAPGITQLLGEPLEAGERVPIQGEIPADAHLVVRVEEGGEVLEARFDGPELPEGGVLIVEEERGEAEVRVEAPGGAPVTPDEEELLP